VKTLHTAQIWPRWWVAENRGGDAVNKQTETALATPWGIADNISRIGGEGILQVETPSHGGYYVPDALLGRMSKDAQASAVKWSGSKNWYEEDCSWAYVALAFPELFLPDAIEHAKIMIEWLSRPWPKPAPVCL